MWHCRWKSSLKILIKTSPSVPEYSFSDSVLLVLVHQSPFYFKHFKLQTKGCYPWFRVPIIHSLRD